MTEKKKKRKEKKKDLKKALETAKTSLEIAVAELVDLRKLTAQLNGTVDSTHLLNRIYEKINRLDDGAAKEALKDHIRIMHEILKEESSRLGLLFDSYNSP